MSSHRTSLIIIPYQEIIGNYSMLAIVNASEAIIPYQEIIGNYSCFAEYVMSDKLYHTKK